MYICVYYIQNASSRTKNTHFPVDTGLKFNFNKFSATQVQSWNSAYDVGSLMHYNSYAFSSNGKPTITDLEGNVLETQVSLS